MVIGGGSAGFAAAITAAEQDRTVGMVNVGPLGGTCTNRGCIPSKTLIRAAEKWHRSGRAPFRGVHTTQIELAELPGSLVVLGGGRLLGAHLVIPEAGEVVQAATLAVEHGLTVNDLIETLFPYLTYSEGLRLAALSFDTDLTKLSCCL